jgi:hypothetical protein
MQKIHILFFLLATGTYGCGVSTNPLGRTIPASHKKAFDVHLTLAQSAYDQEHISLAHDHATAAYGLNAFSERAAILVGYSKLGLLGITPFGLLTSLTQKSNSGNLLTDMINIVGITSDKISTLGTLDTSDSTYPILVPFCAGKSRTLLRTLQVVTASIQTLCKFVDSDVRLSNDPRHQCKPISKDRNFSNQSRSLWGILHLIEGVVFNAALHYPNLTGTGTTNLEARSAKLAKINVKDPSQIPTLIQELHSFSTIVQQVFPISGVCASGDPQTQFLALTNDLIVVDAVFKIYPNIPNKIKAPLEIATTAVANAQVSSASVQEKLGSVQGAFNTKVSKSVATVLKQVKSSDLTPDNIQALCAAYSSIAGIIPNDPNKPAYCS